MARLGVYFGMTASRFPGARPKNGIEGRGGGKRGEKIALVIRSSGQKSPPPSWTFQSLPCEIDCRANGHRLAR